MVIDGQAVLVHGRPRFTEDIDVTLGIDVDEFRRLLSTLEAMQLGVMVDDLEPFVRETYVLPTRDFETDFLVDFTFSNSPYERQAIDRAEPIAL